MGTLIDLQKLKKVQWWEYAVRFGMGGAISAAAAIAGQTIGDSVGGALLAFPAILPASLSLLEEKEGKRCTTEHAEGAPFGGLGLAAFAAALWATASALRGWALLVAVAAWVVVALASLALLQRIPRLLCAAANRRAILLRRRRAVPQPSRPRHAGAKRREPARAHGGRS